MSLVSYPVVHPVSQLLKTVSQARSEEVYNKEYRGLGLFVSADYVFSRHNIFGGPSFTQNNFRAGVGVAYSFGGTETAAQVARAHAPASPQGSMPIPALGIMVSPRADGGAEIVEMLRGSVAELAMLRVGDVITAVDGKPVKTPMALAAQLQHRTPSSQVHLGYMFRSSALGYFPKETDLILGAQK